MALTRLINFSQYTSQIASVGFGLQVPWGNPNIYKSSQLAGQVKSREVKSTTVRCFDPFN